MGGLMGRQTDIPSYRERQTERDKQTNFKLDDFKQGRCVCAWCVSVSVHLSLSVTVVVV